MSARARRAVIDAMLMLAAIIGALLTGMAFGPLLTAGQADPLAFWPYGLAAMLILGAFAAWRGTVRASLFLTGWAFAGCVAAVLLLCGIAAGRWPLPSSPAVAASPREPLAVLSALDLDQRGAGAQPALALRFEVDRLDSLSPITLRSHRRLLLAQPRLLQPQELVALDAWIRAGGDAVILADPLLLWPDDRAPGDRRRPPLTSLLDPLLTHWGLRLDPASGDGAIVRRFAGPRLLRLAGASRFAVSPSGFAHCRAMDDGWMTLCAVGRGQVRLIADADLLDARLWRAGASPLLASDAIPLVDRWLRDPFADPSTDAGVVWVRTEATVREGLRSALAFGTIWAIMGAGLLLAWDERGKAGRTRPVRKKDDDAQEQV